MRRQLPLVLISAGVLLLIASVAAPWFADGLTVPFQYWTLGVGATIFIAGCVAVILPPSGAGKSGD